MHYTVLVVGKNPEEQLAKFNENDNLKVINNTKEVKERYKGKSNFYKNIETKQLFSPYEDEFYRDPLPEEIDDINEGFSKDWGDGRGYRKKIRYCPDGFEEVNVTYKEFYGSFERYILEHEGFKIYTNAVEAETDERRERYFGIRAYNGIISLYIVKNPNEKWDWYELGGRWDGFFKTKDDINCNACIKGDIDIEKIKQLDKQIKEKYWSDAFEKYPNDCEKDITNRNWLYGIKKDMTKEEYINMFSFVTHSILIDGIWYDRDDKRDNDKTWEEIFDEMWMGISRDETVSVYDYHI